MGLFRKILRGILSINLFPPPRPPYKAPKIKSVEKTMRENWETVGKDLQQTMDKIDKEIINENRDRNASDNRHKENKIRKATGNE